jgi:hypothetical protein
MVRPRTFENTTAIEFKTGATKSGSCLRGDDLSLAQSRITRLWFAKIDARSADATERIDDFVVDDLVVDVQRPDTQLLADCHRTSHRTGDDRGNPKGGDHATLDLLPAFSRVIAI